MPSNAYSAPATAAGVGTRTASPAPLAPYGPSGWASSTMMTSTGGIAAAGRIPSDLSVVVTGTESSVTNASVSARPRPMWTPPSTWPSRSVGFIARPTSWAATTRARRPSSSRITTWVAQP